MCQNKTKSELKHTKKRKKQELQEEKYFEELDCYEEILEQFIETICDTLKRCTVLSNYTDTKYDDFLLFNTYDDELKEIGCIDAECYMLNSKFIYRRLRFRAKQQLGFQKPRMMIPDYSTFYERLYNSQILAHGIFYKKALYKLSVSNMENGGVPKWYFFIPKSIIGFNDTEMKRV